jgi:hypothetical protein
MGGLGVGLRRITVINKTVKMQTGFNSEARVE